MNSFLKSLFYLVIFSILHFGYDLTHCSFLKPFCGVDESVFQHLKMTFWSYLFVSLLEYFITKRKSGRRKTFWYPRFLAAIIIPWLTMLIWYIPHALYGRIENLILDVLWSIFATYVAAVISGIFEKSIENISFTSKFKIIIIILIIILAFLSIWFSYKPPWIDLFINPELL